MNYKNISSSYIYLIIILVFLIAGICFCKTKEKFGEYDYKKWWNRSTTDAGIQGMNMNQIYNNPKYAVNCPTNANGNKYEESARLNLKDSC